MEMKSKIVVRAFVGQATDLMDAWNSGVEELRDGTSNIVEDPEGRGVPHLTDTEYFGIVRFGPDQGWAGENTGNHRLAAYSSSPYLLDLLAQDPAFCEVAVTDVERAAAELDCAVEALRRAVNKGTYKRVGQLILEMYPEARKESTETEAYIRAAELALEDEAKKSGE